jgi:hypothetical protein
VRVINTDLTIIVAIIAAVGVIISAVIAFAGVIISAVVSKLTSGRSLYINAVTVERSKWIEKLRNNIATCSGDLRTLSYKMERTLAMSRVAPINLHEQDPLVQKINILISLVSLQLNPSGEIDKNIIKILAEMPALAGSPYGQRRRTADELLIGHSQWLLKAEWEKVKAESRGIILRGCATIRAHYHLRRYRKFCRAEGPLSLLASD